MADRSDRRKDADRAEPGPARLYALGAGGFLALLGVLGFFFDAGFDTGRDLAADDVAGIIVVNGWRNVLYLASGLLALALAPRRPRATAAALGGLYLVLGIWGLIVTDHDIGSILEVLPLTDEDNVLHLVIGALGMAAALADGPLPRPSRSNRRRSDGRAAARAGDRKHPAAGSSRSRA
jgi:uncharacterized protein DUF4383